MDIETIISCAVCHFWMPPLTADQRTAITRNIQTRFGGTNTSAGELARMSPPERKQRLIDLGFTGAQLPMMLRAAQECSELAAMPRAVSKGLRFVNVQQQQQQQPLSATAIASNIAWSADEWSVSSANGYVVLGSHPSIDGQMRELQYHLRESARFELLQQRQHQQQQQQSGGSAATTILASGIRNQGATCYLNSLLQVLYHLPKLRQAVFALPLFATASSSPATPTASSSSAGAAAAHSVASSGFGDAAALALQAAAATDDRNISISRALQRLFATMEIAKERNQLSSCTTRELTASFGWSGSEAFVQHDIHECATLMLERLDTAVDKLLVEPMRKKEQQRENPNENKQLQTTRPAAAQQEDDENSFEGNEHGDDNVNQDNNSNNNQDDEDLRIKNNDVHKLFVIKVKHYFRALDIDYRRSRIEDARYLWLPVKGCPTIYHSLDSYFMEETLDGDAKLCVERRNGKKSYHPAKKGVLMQKAPPVILMCLMRSDFDPQTGEPVKVVTRNEYYRSLDLTKYMATSSPPGSNKYNLQAVVVHSGIDAGFGHYYAFARVHVDRELCEQRDDLRHYLYEADQQQAKKNGSDKGNNDQQQPQQQPSTAAAAASATSTEPPPRPRCWLKLNDESVSLASDYEVFGNNFGGSKRNFWGGTEMMTTNAALLVYVRESDEDEVLFDPARVPDLMPQALRDEHDEMQRAATRKRVEQAETRTQSALHAVSLNSLVLDKDGADKWLFGCPWNTHAAPAKFVGSFPKQAKLTAAVRRHIFAAVGVSDEETTAAKPTTERFLIAYAPEAGVSSTLCYRGPHRIIHNTAATAATTDESPALAVAGSNVVFVLEQPAWLSPPPPTATTAAAAAETQQEQQSQQQQPAAEQVVTFHRFYDPIREAVVPLGAIVSQVDAASARPRDLVHQLLHCVRFCLSQQQQQNSDDSTPIASFSSTLLSSTIPPHLVTSFRFAEASLEDAVARLNKLNNSSGSLVETALATPPDFHVYREETPGSVSPILGPTLLVQNGATYIWQPHPEFVVAPQFRATLSMTELRQQLNSTNNGNAKIASSSVASSSAVATPNISRGASQILTDDCEPQQQQQQESDNHAAKNGDVAAAAAQHNSDASSNGNGNGSNNVNKTVEQLARFPTVFAWANYQRNKCTVRLCPADFRRGFPTVATVEAAGDTGFDEFVHLAAVALGLPQDKEPYLRLARNASTTDNPECPPNSIAWIRSQSWTSLSMALRCGQRTGFFFYDVLTCCTREEANSTRPVLTFEFFDAARVKPVSRHHVALPSYGTFTFSEMLQFCRECVLNDHKYGGEQQQQQSSSSNGNNAQNDDDGDNAANSNNNSSKVKVDLNTKALLDSLAKPDARYAILDIWNGRIYNKTASDDPLGVLGAVVKNLETNADYRLEVLPPLSASELQQLQQAQQGTTNNGHNGNGAHHSNNNTNKQLDAPMTITVVHFSLRPSPTDKTQNVTVLHGDPFYHRLEPGETIQRFRLRIAERLQLSQQRVDRWIVRFVGAGGFNPIACGTADNAAPLAVQFLAAREKATRKNDVWVGLEHAPLAGTRAQASQQRQQERGFHI